MLCCITLLIMEQESVQNKFDLKNNKDNSSAYQLQKVNQMHREIIRLITLGYKNKHIAQALGITEPTVRSVRDSELTQAHIESLQTSRDENTTDIAETIRNFAPLALEVATEIMIDNNVSPAVRINAAHDIMDRAGYKPIDVSVRANGKLSSDEIEEVKERARQNGLKVRREAEEAEYEELPPEEKEEL